MSAAELRFYRTVGERIRVAREAHGWTQLRLATELGVSQVAVHHWEQGTRRPSVYILSQIERRIGWTVTA